MTQVFKNFITEFEVSALPLIKEGKNFTFYISNSMAQDESLRELIGMKPGMEGEAKFMGVRIAKQRDTKIEEF